MKKIIITILLAVAFFSFFSPILVSAQSEGVVTLDNPLGQGVTPQTLIGRVINAVLGIVGSLTLLMFIYGGILWMTAAGNSEQISKGKAVLVWAIIGLVVVFSSYSLVKFILNRGLGV